MLSILFPYSMLKRLVSTSRQLNMMRGKVSTFPFCNSVEKPLSGSMSFSLSFTFHHQLKPKKKFLCLIIYQTILNQNKKKENFLLFSFSLDEKYNFLQATSNFFISQARRSTCIIIIIFSLSLTLSFCLPM